MDARTAFFDKTFLDYIRRSSGLNTRTMYFSKVFLDNYKESSVLGTPSKDLVVE